MLLDTSGLLCLLYASQDFHEQAVALFSEAERRLVHKYVIAELMALGSARALPRNVILRYAEELQRDALVEVVWVDQTLHRDALTLLRARPDKNYSLCDAVSFVLMKREHVHQALTTDRHFEQEGFEWLLR